MNTLNLGIELDQGTDFSLVVGIFGENGPIDITGYSFLSQMRASTDPTAAVLAEFDFEILDQVTNTGQVRWYLPHAGSDSIATTIANALIEARYTTPYVYDVKMKDLIGNISRIIQGVIYLSPEATQESFS